jgi:hypothetical protein
MGGLDAEVAEVINAHIDAHGTMVDFAAATARAGAGGHLDGMYVPNLAIDRLMNSDTGKVVKAVFTSDDEAAREAVTKALLEMPDKAIPAMLDTVQEATDGPTVESVAASLKEFKDPTPWIASRLGKEMEPWQLANLVRLFAMVAAPESARALEPVLASPEVEPHLEALKALGALGGKAALSMLLDESMSPDPQMQVPALRGLGRFHDYSAVRRLTLLITPGRKGEIFESDQALIAACRSLGELKADRRGGGERLSEEARQGLEHAGPLDRAKSSRPGLAAKPLLDRGALKLPQGVRSYPSRAGGVRAFQLA